MLGFFDRAVDLAEKCRLRHQIINDADLECYNKEQETGPAPSSVVQPTEEHAVVLRVDRQMTEASATLNTHI